MLRHGTPPRVGWATARGPVHGLRRGLAKSSPVAPIVTTNRLFLGLFVVHTMLHPQ
ncbi:hypothetical protein MHAS44199_22870 [Mycolicibacterium hassiacum DSM 44199]|nr:hypothetical protein [Mycolicibacterium hassiacum DSM 44199]